MLEGAEMLDARLWAALEELSGQPHYQFWSVITEDVMMGGHGQEFLGVS